MGQVLTLKLYPRKNHIGSAVIYCFMQNSIIFISLHITLFLSQQIPVLVIGLTQLSFCRDGTLPSATRRGSCSGAQCAPRSRVRGSTCVGTSIARPRLRSKQSPGRAIQPGPLSRLGWICLRQIAFVPNAGRAMLVPTVCLLMKVDKQNPGLSGSYSLDLVQKKYSDAVSSSEKQ